MTTATQAIQWEAKYQSQPGDNGGAFAWKLAGAPGYTGSAWCGCFQYADALNLKLDLGPFTLASVIYVPSALNIARSHGLYRVSKQSKPGDWVIFDWSGRESGADHIGMIVANDPSKSYVTTIEGNAGAAANGQRHVAYHTRDRSLITGTINRQAAYKKGTTTPITASNLKVDGLLGAETISAWQKQCGTTVDGVISAGGSRLVEFQQKFLNSKGVRDRRGKKLVVDGVGVYDNTAHATKTSHTQEALQRYWGTTVDGVFSHPSAAVKELQLRLNKLAK